MVVAFMRPKGGMDPFVVLRWRCCTIAVQTINLPITHRLKPLVVKLEPMWGCEHLMGIAHTGNAREGSPMFADVLCVLHSWVWCSLGIAKVRCFSPALLYGLLYKQAP